MTSRDESRTIILTYLVASALFTLATSIIWAVNTLFLLGAGLPIFQVFIVNTAFTAGDLLFEVPTGVVADTLGRKVSFLASIAILAVATLAYLSAAQFEWGVGAFFGASIFLGLGFTFYAGSVEAWLVDALDRVGYERPIEQVFAWGGIAFSVSMVAGTLIGGILGQIDLRLPYLARAGALVLTFVIVLLLMDDSAFERKALTGRAFAEETRRIIGTGARVGWRSRVVRPLLGVSIVQGVFFIFGFYSWQRYFLDLLGREAVWVNGVIASGFGLAGIVGNLLVKPVTREGTRDPARLLAVVAIVQAVVVFVVGAIGYLPGAIGGGLAPFLAAALLYMLYGTSYGFTRPVRQALINRHIPSRTRATMLSIDYLCQDVGETIGQPGLGYIAQATSIAFAWMAGGVSLLAAPVLYVFAARGEREEGARGGG